MNLERFALSCFLKSSSSQKDKYMYTDIVALCDISIVILVYLVIPMSSCFEDLFLYFQAKWDNSTQTSMFPIK